MLTRRKPPCRCHWPVTAGVVNGEVQYVCVYCGAPLISLKALQLRRAKQERLKEELLRVQQENEAER